MMSHPGPSFLEPVSLTDFFEHYWEKQPLYIAREAEIFSKHINPLAIEHLLASRSVYFPGVQLTQSGAVINVDDYADADSRILPLRLVELHRQGATIVMSQAQKLFAPLNDLCRETLRTLHMGCQTNIYLSPPAKQGFNPHYDTHDVFILQVSGAKTFNFYASSVELPLPEESFDASRPRGTEPDESIRLTAGDTLYIPRGMVHDAVAENDEPSLHITLGVYPLLVRDVLLDRITSLATRDRRLRKAVHPSLYVMDDAANVLQSELAQLLSDLVDPLTDVNALDEVVSDYLDKLAVEAPQDCSGLLTQPSIMTGGAGTAGQSCEVLKLYRDRILDFERGPDSVRIRSYGHIIEFTEPVAAVVFDLLRQGYLHKHQWQALESAQQEAMIERLMHDNLAYWTADTGAGQRPPEQA